MISIYPPNEIIFSDNGLKILKPLKALIRKEDNNDYYIDLKDTVDNLEYYQAGNIVKASTPWGNQCFRLTNPNIENNKIIVRGQHIFFDSANYIIKDSYIVDKNANEALDHLNSATDVTSPFTTISDIQSIYSYRCVRKSLQEAVTDIISRWGGHLVRNNMQIEVRQNIGQDRGVVLSYGKNIIGIKSQEIWDNIVTKLMPVGKDGLLLPEVWLYGYGNSNNSVEDSGNSDNSSESSENGFKGNSRNNSDNSSKSSENGFTGNSVDVSDNPVENNTSSDSANSPTSDFTDNSSANLADVSTNSSFSNSSNTPSSSFNDSSSNSANVSSNSPTGDLPDNSTNNPTVANPTENTPNDPTDNPYDIPFTRVISFEQNEILEEDFKDDEGKTDVEGYNNALINDLRTKGLAYLNENSVPKVSYSLSAYLKPLSLRENGDPIWADGSLSRRHISDVGDTIYVKHPKCRINIETNVIALEYDVILDKITKVEFGNFKNTLKNLVKTLESKIDFKVGVSESNTTARLEKELEEATNKINGVLGNSYVIYDGSQILVLDKLPKEESVNVMRINAGGIGFSQTGINGTFSSAWTLDGTFDAQQINAINISGSLIKGGTLKLGSNLDESGNLELYDESNTLICEIDKDGIEVFCNDGSRIRLNNEEGLVGYDPEGVKFYQGFGNEFDMTKADVSEELTISDKLRFLPLTTDTNTGVGIVAMA